MSGFWSRKIKMMCRFENKYASYYRQGLKRNSKKRAFSLVEVVTSLTILALMSSSVLLVINRCVTSATDSSLRMQAFEVARENMEKLVSSSSVQESVEYGESDRYAGIMWETVVETFYEPITARMWIRGVCSAQYIDSEGQEQTVELIHWLTDLSKKQLLEIMSREEDEGQIAAQLIETLEEGAEYAGVDVETIERWLENGMLTTEDGYLIKMNLDIYKLSGGNPTPEEKNRQVDSETELMRLLDKEGRLGGTKADAQSQQGELDPKTGLTYEELENMSFQEIWELMKNRRRQGF